MSIKEILEYWKLILGIVVVVSTASIGVYAWAEDQKQLIRAERELIHNKLYQEARVDKKRNQIQDNLKMIKLLSSDDISEQEEKFIESLENENTILFKEIEEIEASLHE